MNASLKERIKSYTMDLGVDDIGFGAVSDERKKMMGSPEYMGLYQSAFIGFQYNCFNCYMLCPIGK